MKTYLELLDKIKYFAKSKFKGVYSRSFAKHVIINSHNPKSEDFSVIYGDFNRLNEINQKYSEKVGDVLITNTYTTIHEVLHQYFPTCEYSISQVGGDEFLIIVDSCDETRLKDCFECIHNILDVEKNTPKFVDFAYGIVTSDEEKFDTIYDMINKAEHKQAVNKIFPNNKEYTFEEALKIRTDKSISNFFKNFRLNNYINFDIKENSLPNSRDIRVFISDLLDNTIKLLSAPNKINELTDKLTEVTPIPNMYSHTSLSKKQCLELYKYVNNSETDIQYLEGFNINDLYSFLNVLIREPVSGCYNKPYFDYYFINAFKNSRDFFSTAILVDTTYMKDSNLKIGHGETDNKMKLISSQLQNEIESIHNRPFSENNFSINPDSNYIFDLGGGNYLIFSRDSIDKQDVDKIIELITPNCQPLGLVYSMENIENRKDIQNILNSLYTNCSTKKYSSKSASLNSSEESLIEAFNLFLSPTLKYYLENHPGNSLDINELRNFMDILSTSVITQSSEYINNTENNKKIDDIQSEK